MIRITERTTRFVCRLAFGIGCIAPSVVVLALCLWQTLPFAESALERHLTATLGLNASVDKVQTPRLNRLRLHQLQLRDPGSGALLANISRIDAGQVGNELVVWMRGVQVTQPGTEAIEELILRRVRQRLAPDAPVVRLVMSELAIESPGEPLLFDSAAVHFEPFPNGAQARLRMLTKSSAATSEQAAPIRLRIFRRCTPDDAMFIEWQNGDCPLPSQFLANLLPRELAAGETSTFAGNIRLEKSRGTWSGQMDGRLDSIDLADLVPSADEPLARGRGRLELEQFAFHDGRITQAVGQFRTEAGDIGTARLAAIAESLQLKTDFLVAPPAEPRLTFQQMAFRFDLNGDGLQLDGLCEGAEPGLIADAWGPLLISPDSRRRRISQLLEAAADHRLGAPPVDTEQLARRLPRGQRPIVETADRQPRRFE